MKQPFYNVSIDNLSSTELNSYILSSIRENKQILINFLNAHCFNIAQSDSEYMNILKNSDVLLNDGIGIDIGAKLLGFSFKENMNGTDLIPKILETCEAQNLSTFLLGSKNDVIKKAKDEIQTARPNLTIAGYSDGYFENSLTLIDSINSSKADVLIIGMGVPLQEKWAQKHRHQLASVKIIVCGGAIFDFLSKTTPRAPKWIQDVKMEWAYRFYIEPKRLFKRYMIGNFLFLFRILRLSIQTGRQSASKP